MTERTVRAAPFDIVTGPDGNLWFTDRGTGAIGRITPAFTKLHIYPLPPPPSTSVGRAPDGITVGPDGNIWYADASANKVGNITTSGVITEFALANSGSRPQDIVSGPDGNLWLTEAIGNRVARITPNGIVNSMLLPHPPSFAQGITAGPDGRIWFNEANDGTQGHGGRIGVLDPARVKEPPPPCETISNSIVLTHDLGPCAGDGILVAADNITIDLGGHHVFAAPGPRGGDFAGIRMPGLSRVTVKHGEVSGFDAGVVLDGGSSNTISGLNVHDNLGPSDPQAALGDGIDIFHSAHNNIANNVIAHNGPFNGVSILGNGSDFNLVQGNNVHDNTDKNLGQKVSGGGTGILIDSFLEIEAAGRGTSLTGNDVIGNSVHDNISSGISLVSDTSALVKKNIVNHNGFYPNGHIGNFPGNGIGIQRNRLATSVTKDIVTYNVVTNSAVDGIQFPNTDGNEATNNHVSGARFGVTIFSGHSNTITDNVAQGGTMSDLYDGNTDSPCDSNIWFENTYSTANPVCTTAGGRRINGPPPPPADRGGPALKTVADQLQSEDSSPSMR